MRVSVAALVLLILVGCAPEGGGTSSAADDHVHDGSADHSHDTEQDHAHGDDSGIGGVEGVEPGREAFEGVPFEASEFEQQILNDGVVTDAELDRALAATEACIQDAGYDATYNVNSFGAIGLSVIGGSDDDPDGKLSGTVARCEADFSDAVRETYFNQSSPTPDELARAEELFFECIAEAGVTLSEQSFEAAELEAPGDVMQECLSR